MKKEVWQLLAISVIALLVGLLASVFVSQQSRKLPADVSATILPQAKTLQDFHLRSHDQQDFSLATVKGQWTFLFFGYTFCPDVCPMTLSTLSQVHKKLIAEKFEDTVQFVFVSVDPERDTLERLAQYVPYYDPEFIGVTGEQKELDKLTKQLGILSIKVPSESGDANNYLVDHSTAIILLNPKSQLQAIFSTPHRVDNIVSDLGKIRRYYEGLQ